MLIILLRAQESDTIESDGGGRHIKRIVALVVLLSTIAFVAGRAMYEQLAVLLARIPRWALTKETK